MQFELRVSRTQWQQQQQQQQHDQRTTQMAHVDAITMQLFA